MLYCMQCEKMVQELKDCDGILYHLKTIRVNNAPDPGDRYDVFECVFPAGIAYAPPPEFDMEQFMAGAEMELFVDIPGYDYDVERDEIVEVLL